MSWAVCHPFLQLQTTLHTPAPAPQPSPSLPAPKELVGPTGLLQPLPPLRTTCCAIMSRPFTSAPAGDQGQAQEERVRQSEEGGSILGPQTFLIVSPGAQWAGAPQPVFVMLCIAWTFQPPIVTPGKEATLFRVEAVEDSKALVDEDVVGIEWEFQLLAEDSTKEVEVVTDDERQQGFSQELEEKTVEEQGWERPGGPSELPALDELQALAALRVELSSEHEKNHRAYIRFMHKSHQRRKSHLAWRSAIIQGIPGFWAKAVSFLLLLGVRCSGGGGERAGGVLGARALEAPEGSVVLGNWQALKGHPSRIWAGPHLCWSHDFESLLLACI